MRHPCSIASCPHAWHHEPVCPNAGAARDISAVQLAAVPLLAVVEDDDEGVAYVEDNGGDTHEIIPGDFSEEAQWLYKNGQCMALAMEISRATGWPLAVHRYRYKHDDFDEDQPEDEIENPRWHRSLKHAMVLAPEGDYLDIAGYHDPQGYEEQVEDEDEWVDIVPAQQAQDYFSQQLEGYLSRQDFAVAAVFAQEMLKGEEIT